MLFQTPNQHNRSTEGILTSVPTMWKLSFLWIQLTLTVNTHTETKTELAGTRADRGRSCTCSGWVRCRRGRWGSGCFHLGRTCAYDRSSQRPSLHTRIHTRTHIHAYTHTHIDTSWQKMMWDTPCIAELKVATESKLKHNASQQRPVHKSCQVISWRRRHVRNQCHCPEFSAVATWKSSMSTSDMSFPSPSMPSDWRPRAPRQCTRCTCWGLNDVALQHVYRSVVIARLMYAWHGLTKASDQHRINSLIDRATCYGYYTPDLPKFEELCMSADEQLFSKTVRLSNHVLHALLPPSSTASQHYSLRHRTHSLQLPQHSTNLSDCNFLARMLYADCH